MSYAQELAARYSDAHKRLLDPPPKPKPEIVEAPAKPKIKTSEQRPLFALSTEIVSRPRLSDLLRLAADEEGIHLAALTGPRRRRDAVTARWIYFYLAHRLTRLSLIQIGGLVGGKDHTTVLNGVREIEKKMERSEVWKAKIAKLMRLVDINYTRNPHQVICPSCQARIELG